MDKVEINRFSSLFREGKIGKLNVKNRIIMGAMGNALADAQGYVTDAMLSYYRARAEGGAGMIITQFASINPEDPMPYSLALYDDKFIPGLKKLVDAVHDSEASACIQLMHPGMLLTLLRSAIKEQTIKVPSVTPWMAGSKPFAEVTGQDIKYYVKCFAQAAVRAVKTGADAIELHACHGCLLSTFLSPTVNRRTDKYGGNIENRVRFIREVLEAIKQNIGDLPLLVRINGTDDMPGGVSENEVIQYVRTLESAGADAISISSGLEYWSALMAPSYAEAEGAVLPIAKKVKNSVKIPVITAGKINPELAQVSIEKGTVDFVAFGRPLLADPTLPNKLKENRPEDICQCIYCNNCINHVWPSCTVNPFVYRESMLPFPQAPSPKKIMIIGGGIAGMQAADILSMRGHDVSLYEREQELGGQWNIACHLPDKKGYYSVIERLTQSMNNHGVHLYTGIQITGKYITELKPDVVITATGAKPIKLDVPGINNHNVIQANDVLAGKAVASGKVAVIGGRMLGMETALLLSAQGKEVILVSRSGLGGKKGPDESISFRALLRRMIDQRIPSYLNTAVLEITGNHVIVRIGEEIVSLPADTVVLAIGVESDDRLAKELEEVAPQIFSIGDCLQPGNAAQAAFSAARLALKI
ncbi:FAD-dependent oxidoreductase [Chloroflexota bacterium]